MKNYFTILLLLLIISPVRAFQENEILYEIGKKVEIFTLNDLTGKPFDLYKALESPEVKGVAVVFISYICPASRASDMRYIQHAADFSEKGILFIGIGANSTETPEEMKVYAEGSGYNFPVLWDYKNVIADRFGALTTPHAFFIDKNGILRYSGRVDDSANNPLSVEERTLEMIVNEYLEGKELTVTTTRPQG